jgi:DNA repair ATPase RecN
MSLKDQIKELDEMHSNLMGTLNELPNTLSKVVSRLDSESEEGKKYKERLFQIVGKFNKLEGKESKALDLLNEIKSIAVNGK